MKVVITSKLPKQVYNMLDEFTLDINNSSEPLPTARLMQMLSNAEGIISTKSDNINKTMIDVSPNLKIIANCDAECDNIDIDYATYKGITVCSTKQILTQSTAELGVALMMNVARRINEVDKYTKIGTLNSTANHDSILGVDLYKKSLGIYGMGYAGQIIAKIAAGFSMDIIYHDTYRNKQAELLAGATYATIDELLEWSDFIIITSPATSENKHLFTLKEFKKMKKTSIIVNVGGGHIIKEKDLVTALKENIIFGAALDCHEAIFKINDDLKKLNNVILTPYISSATYSTKNNMAISCAESIISELKGGITPHTAINKEVIL